MWDLIGNPEDRFSHNEAHIFSREYSSTDPKIQSFHLPTASPILLVTVSEYNRNILCCISTVDTNLSLKKVLLKTTLSHTYWNLLIILKGTTVKFTFSYRRILVLRTLPVPVNFLYTANRQIKFIKLYLFSFLTYFCIHNGIRK